MEAFQHRISAPLRLAIVIPFYNKAAYVQETIGSVMEVPLRMDRKLIVTDGCSKDGNPSTLALRVAQMPEILRDLKN